MFLPSYSKINSGACLSGKECVPEKVLKSAQKLILALRQSDVGTEVTMQRHPVAATIETKSPGQLTGPQSPHATTTLVKCPLQGLLSNEPAQAVTLSHNSFKLNQPIHTTNHIYRLRKQMNMKLPK